MSRFRRKNDRPRFKRNGRPEQVSQEPGQPIIPSLPISKGGRPSLYDPDIHPKYAYDVCRAFGATMQQLADAILIPLNTLHQWNSKHQELKQAIKAGRDIHDTERVERTLLQRAMGYDYTEKRVKYVRVRGVDADGVAVALPAEEVTETYKRIAPNLTAIIFWLKNRQPDRWRDVQAVDIKSEHKEEKVVRYEMLAGLKLEFDKLEVNELEKLLTHFREPAIDIEPSSSGGDVRTVDVG